MKCNGFDVLLVSLLQFQRLPLSLSLPKGWEVAELDGAFRKSALHEI